MKNKNYHYLNISQEKKKEIIKKFLLMGSTPDEILDKRLNKINISPEELFQILMEFKDNKKGFLFV
jgi:hypothetical protein